MHSRFGGVYRDIYIKVSYEKRYYLTNHIYFKEEKMISQNSGYWTADQFGNYPDYAWGAAVSWNCFTQGMGKPNGLLIRPVMDK